MLAGWAVAADGPADPDTPVTTIKRDPASAAACTRRVHALFVNTI